MSGGGKFAAKTDVTASRTRDEIESTLTRYGADQFLYGWQEDKAVVGFRMKGRQIKFILPLPNREDPAFTEYMQGSSKYRRSESEITKRFDQAVRQRWRALLLVIKAKLEAVESGITVFEDEFMAHIVLPTGETVGDWLRPQIEQAYLTGAMPSLLMLEGPGK